MTGALAAHLSAVLHHALAGGEAPGPVPDGDVAAAGDDAAPAGAFVALTVGGALRGFVGSVAPRGSFAATAAELVRRALAEDPRFAPPAAGEAVTLTVYRVGPVRPVSGPADLVAGRDGVWVREGFHRAVHLPLGTDAADPVVFLESACLAAGLHPGAYARPEVQVGAFSVERVMGPPQGGVGAGAEPVDAPTPEGGC